MPRRSSTLAVFTEALLVVIAAVGFAVAANQISPRGLVLTRNYFPSGTKPAIVSNAPPPVAVATNEDQGDPEVTQRLKDKGLQPIGRAQTERLFHDPDYLQGRIIFVDARNAEHYADGHIPGAVQLDPYHPEKQLPDALAACMNADKIVVYCTGGDCEDADSTAILLRDAGVPAARLFVYGGGFTEWSDKHLPIEEGARNSGAVSGTRK